DIDYAIQGSVTWRQFMMAMERQGYEFKEGKHLAIRSPGQERFIRLRSLGDGYQIEDITQRILRNRVPNPRPATVNRPVPKKLTGLRALYWKYLYLMGIVHKGQYTKRPSNRLRADIMKMHRIAAECRLINRNRIETLEQLHSFKASTIKKIECLKEERTQLHIQKNATLPEERFSLVGRIAELNKELSRHRKELRMADSIEKRSLEIAERIAEAERPEPEPKEKKPQRELSR
ncbi:MAG: relaxase/mobilization nuclease, partial [Bacillota bacterium]